MELLPSHSEVWLWTRRFIWMDERGGCMENGRTSIHGRHELRTILIPPTGKGWEVTELDVGVSGRSVHHRWTAASGYLEQSFLLMIE